MKAETYLPKPLKREAGEPHNPLPEGKSTTSVQIGDVIIHDEDLWQDIKGAAVYSLLLADGSVFDETEYPVLFSVRGVNTLESIPNEIGSTVPYKYVADLTGG